MKQVLHNKYDTRDRQRRQSSRDIKFLLLYALFTAALFTALKLAELYF
jgi:hypothetical protein